MVTIKTFKEKIGGARETRQPHVTIFPLFKILTVALKWSERSIEKLIRQVSGQIKYSLFSNEKLDFFLNWVLKN